VTTATQQRVIRLPSPHPGQMYVRKHSKRHNIVRAGRRWRKTTHVMSIVVEGALKGQRWIWGAPTYDQVRICWDETLYAAAGVADFRKSDMMAEFPGGGRITFRSLDDPDNLRGNTADGAVMDEAQAVKDGEHAYFEVIRPMMMTTGGSTWILYTPPPSINWIYTLEQNAAKFPDFACFHAPTLGVDITDTGLVRRKHPLENPYIPLSEVQQLYDSMTEDRFRREILAEWTGDDGQVFRNVSSVVRKGDDKPWPNPRSVVSEALSIVSDEVNRKLQVLRGAIFVAGIDWARSNDYTDLRIWAILPEPRQVTATQVAQRVEVDWLRMSGLDTGTQQRRIIDKCRSWGVTGGYAEYNAIGIANVEAIQNAGVPIDKFITTNQKKARAVDRLAAAIEKSLVSLPDVAENQELRTYGQETLPSGLIRYSAPEGMHDDSVVSRMLTNLACEYEPVVYHDAIY
jgi:hypothetical protein